MTPEALAWAIGIGLPVLTGAVLFLANWIHKIGDSQRALGQQVSDLRSHVAENYVRGHEVADVKRAISDLRHELNESVNQLRTEISSQVQELTKSVNQLIGAQQRK